MRGLYAIVDVGLLNARGIDVLSFARAVLVAHPALLQLRAKGLPPREMLALLRTLQPMCRLARVPLVANDRADLAALAGCDFVHVGQEDVAVDIVRRLAPRLGIGVSTHDLDQLARALADRPNYVAYGPVFPTTSKPNPSPVVGLEGLRAAHSMALAAGVPLVAIGGIDHDRAPWVAPLCESAAVISALVPPMRVDAAAAMSTFFAEVTTRTRALHAALLGPSPHAAAPPQ